MTADDVRRLIERKCREAGGQKAWADQIKVSPTFLSEVIRGDRAPSQRILEPLGLKRVTVYRKVKD